MYYSQRYTDIDTDTYINAAKGFSEQYALHCEVIYYYRKNSHK